jgi:mgtE-like transporter
LEALLALSFDLGGILAGRVALLFSPLFESHQWILAIYPCILSVRGNVGGIFSGRLSTMLHIGMAEPRLRGNTQAFYLLVISIFFLTFFNSSVAGLFAFTINLFLGNARLEQLPLFVAVPPITSLLGMTLALPAVSLLGMRAFIKGLDPAIILYPAMSTIEDVLITLCYVAVVWLTLLPILSASILLTMLAFSFAFSAIFLRYRKEKVFRRTLLEGGIIVFLSSILASFGGFFLSGLRGEIEKRPSILTLYPALIDTLGDIGSIIGTMETTKLALGYSSYLFRTIRETFSDLLSVETAAAAIHLLFGVVSFLLGAATGLSPDLMLLVKVALTSNLLSFPFIYFLSIISATQTFKYGLDPDNFVIPLVTSVSDLGATLALIAAVKVMGI